MAGLDQAVGLEHVDHIVEQRIHKELDAHRKPGEFFEGDCEHFFAVIEKYVMKPE